MKALVPYFFLFIPFLSFSQTNIDPAIGKSIQVEGIASKSFEPDSIIIIISSTYSYEEAVAKAQLDSLFAAEAAKYETDKKENYDPAPIPKKINYEQEKSKLITTLGLANNIAENPVCVADQKCVFTLYFKSEKSFLDFKQKFDAYNDANSNGDYYSKMWKIGKGTQFLFTANSQKMNEQAVLKMAIDNAKMKAEFISKNLNIKLGPVVTFKESENGSSAPTLWGKYYDALIREELYKDKKGDNKINIEKKISIYYKILD